MAHQAERARWEHVVNRGDGQCVFCQLPIDPKGDWDLDHNEDRTGWRGPAHVKCNRSAGGRNGAAATQAKRQTTIREW